MPPTPPAPSTGSSIMAAALLAISGAATVVLCGEAWAGHLGITAAAMLAVAATTFMLGRRRLSGTARAQVDFAGKAIFTVLGVMALLRHPIEVRGESAPIYLAIARHVSEVDLRVFILFGLIAMTVKFVGVITSAYGWNLLLIGQGIRYPFWSGIMTAFLIGRFIGTFLPSTIGLDGYTLYEAGRYSNQWQRAVTAKALEKIIGIAGLFLGMVLTMPFGYQVIRDVAERVGRPEAAPLLAGAILAVAGGISLAVVIGLVRPTVLTLILALFGRIVPGGLQDQVRQFEQSVGAYRGRVGLLMMTLAAKFVTHFTTAAVYFFTAIAIGVVGARFWPITFGSTVQILATLLSPTIAGEGARELFQLLLLQKQLGGVAQAVLSAALGFIAAEAATMWGGIFLWTRTPDWRPRFTLVDGVQVDYAWIKDESVGALAAARRGRRR
jgi:hypothetical protein